MLYKTSVTKIERRLKNITLILVSHYLSYCMLKKAGEAEAIIILIFIIIQNSQRTQAKSKIKRKNSINQLILYNV